MKFIFSSHQQNPKVILKNPIIKSFVNFQGYKSKKNKKIHY